MSSSRINPETPFIPLKDILLATENFGPEATLGDDGFGVLYEGQLPERWQNRQAIFKRFHEKVEQESRNKVEIMSKINHENIISLIGYCDEANEMIAVFEFPSNASLRHHLDDVSTKEDLKWGQRLKICLGIARGLEYLHSGLVDQRRVFHGDMIKSLNILLDDNMEAKISAFDLSFLVDDNDAAGTSLYLDPIYKESGVLNTEADVYSFGIIVFEMLTGMLRVIDDDDQPPLRLINLVRRYSHEDRMDKLLVDPVVQDESNIRTVLALKEIALQCISWDLKDRPKMKTIVNRIQEAMDNEKHWSAAVFRETLVFSSEEIIAATENFSSETCIGSGDSATVYKGRLDNRIVAIKRLKPDNHREDNFMEEVWMMSKFHHQNVIALVGVGEKVNGLIMVCDYASNGSLNCHLQDPDKGCIITWAQRLKICLGVARGLKFLHTGIGEDVAVIHRGIKSEIILLDHNMEAKISSFGLSLYVAPDNVTTVKFSQQSQRKSTQVRNRL